MDSAREIWRYPSFEEVIMKYKWSIIAAAYIVTASLTYGWAINHPTYCWKETAAGNRFLNDICPPWAGLFWPIFLSGYASDLIFRKEETRGG